MGNNQGVFNMKSIIKKFGTFALAAVIIFSMAACGGSNNKDKDTGPVKISVAAITGVTAPALGNAPATTIETAQYTGSVTWSPAVSGTFAADTSYTATITLTPKAGFTLQGVSANFFTVAGTSIPATNSADSGVVTAVFPATGVGIELFNGTTSIGVIELTSALLALVDEEILVSTGGRELVSYLLTDVLDAAGATIPAFSAVGAQDADGVNILMNPEDFDIRKAYLVTERIDEPTPPYSPARIIADGTVAFANNAVRQDFEQLVFTPAWEIPEGYKFNDDNGIEFNIEVFNGAELIGEIDVDAFKYAIKYLKQVKFTTTSGTGRQYPGYLLTDVLEAVGISIPAYSEAKTQRGNLTDDTVIANITNSYMVLARIDTTEPETNDYPRIIADVTLEITNSSVRKGFEQLVFTP